MGPNVKFWTDQLVSQRFRKKWLWKNPLKIFSGTKNMRYYRSYRLVKTGGLYLLLFSSYSKNSHMHGLFGRTIVQFNIVPRPNIILKSVVKKNILLFRYCQYLHIFISSRQSILTDYWNDDLQVIDYTINDPLRIPIVEREKVLSDFILRFKYNGWRIKNGPHSIL
jgi:hypothetical protein